MSNDKYGEKSDNKYFQNPNSIQNMNNNLDINNEKYRNLGNTPNYYHQGSFDTNLYLGHNQSSNLNGTNFFLSPISPDYKPAASNINYYNFDNNHETPENKIKTQTINNLITDSRSIIPDTSENATHNLSTMNFLGNLPNTGNPLFPENIQPKLQNIVSTANLKCELELREIALRAKNAEYNPKRFAAVIMRIREPKTTALIFASGKMVCTGARSEEDSKKAARQYAKIINKLGFPVKFSEFKIQNIVGSCDLRFPVRLEGLAMSHALYCSYEPEMFPGLIYRMIKPKIVLLIFVSGKIVLTGAKERNDIFEAFRNIYETLLQFKKKDSGSLSTDLSLHNDG